MKNVQLIFLFESGKAKSVMFVYSGLEKSVFKILTK